MATADGEKEKGKRIRWIVRELFSVACWCYLVIKVAVFDFDTYFAETYFPRLRVILDYKLLFFMCAVCVFWIVLGKKRFPKLAAYVVFYPVIVVFWRIPKLVFRHFPAAVILTPSVFSTIETLRRLLIGTTLACLAGLCILLFSNTVLLYISMGILAVTLIIHLYASFRKAYESTVFGKLRKILSKLTSKISSDEFCKSVFDTVERNNPTSTEEQKLRTKLSTLYAFHGVSEYVGEKIQEVARSRKMDVYLVCRWLWTVVLVVIMYSFQYLGAYKVFPQSFSLAFRPTYWSFLGYSLDKLTHSSISPILPAGSVAAFLSYSELVCAFVILIILVFTILTVARERYKEDIDGIVNEINVIESMFEKYFVTYFNMALEEAEFFLVNNNDAMVKYIRKLRGLPELQRDQSKTRSGTEGVTAAPPTGNNSTDSSNRPT
jgi:hypothetical protein